MKLMQYKTYKNSFIYTWNIDLLYAHIAIIMSDKLLEKLPSLSNNIRHRLEGLGKNVSSVELLDA